MASVRFVSAPLLQPAVPCFDIGKVQSNDGIRLEVFDAGFHFPLRLRMAHSCSDDFDFPVKKKVVEPLGELQGGITLAVFSNQTACIVPNNATWNAPKVTEGGFQTVEPSFLSLVVISSGKYMRREYPSLHTKKCR